MYVAKCIIYLLIVATVSFEQSAYRVNEYDGSVELALVLSNPSSTDITVKVIDKGITATG